MPDPRKNFAYTTVATAPSPAASGTTMTVAHPGRFPDPGVDGAFNVTVVPADATLAEIASDHEIVRVTALAAGVWTIARAQEGTSARSIIAGDQVVMSVTDKVLDDLDTGILEHDRTYTSAELLALATTPLTVITVPAGYVLCVESIAAYYDRGTVSYVQNDAPSYYYGTALTGPTCASIPVNMSTAEDAFGFAGFPGVNELLSLLSAADIIFAGDLSSGNGTLRVRLRYRLVAVP